MRGLTVEEGNRDEDETQGKYDLPLTPPRREPHGVKQESPSGAHGLPPTPSWGPPAWETPQPVSKFKFPPRAMSLAPKARLGLGRGEMTTPNARPWWNVPSRVSRVRVGNTGMFTATVCAGCNDDPSLFFTVF